jgi:hypothetical protein
VPFNATSNGTGAGVSSTRASFQHQGNGRDYWGSCVPSLSASLDGGQPGSGVWSPAVTAAEGEDIMPGFDFDKLKDQAEKYIKEHPEQVKKAEQVGEQQLKKLIGKTQHGHGADDGPEDGGRAEHHDQENPAQHREPDRDGK